MASIQKRPNGKWRARYRDDGGKEHARHFERKTDAQQWLDAETAKLVRGDWADPKAGRETLRAYAGRWEAKAFLVSQKISAISSILAISSIFVEQLVGLAGVELPLVPVAPASLVASLNSCAAAGTSRSAGA
jgi:hypothetical protein